MNVLITGILREFVDRYGYEDLELHQQFERLVAQSIIADSIRDGPSLEDMMASDRTVGYDCLAIFANGDLVPDLDTVFEITERNKPLDISCYFIQAKTSERFQRDEILGFGEAVSDFFQASPRLVESPFTAERRAVKEKLYRHSALFRNRRPIARLFFVTTGNVPTDDPNIEGAAATKKQALLDTGLFEAVEFELVGASELHKRYVQATNRVGTTVNFQRKVPLPKIPGINQAFLGVLPATEFLKMIVDENDSVRRFVFYDNVRDFQDLDNPVNTGILETLRSQDAQLFPVLNNGVTVVAQKMQPVGEDVTIEDYQIVNGCQTSHVLFEARERLDDSVLVPLRLIITEDDLVASKITKATNSQTPVSEADLQALTDFQKRLEAHYAGYDDRQRLYYERRSRQYANSDVKQTSVVTPLVQIRSFAAMFLDEPHLASRYYRRLYERVPMDIFRTDHRLEPYYTSAFTWYLLDLAFRKGRLDAEFRPARYLILSLFKYLALPDEDPPPLNTPGIERYCRRPNTLLTREVAEPHFRRAGELVRLAGDGVITADKTKRERLTKRAIDLAQTARRQSDTRVG
jgi:hypothetical protein